jgi:hypothetical protein
MDTDLIIRAELRATGAEIHRLRNVICVYTSSCHDLEKVDDAETQAIMEESERDLRHFVYTGILERHKGG